MKSFLFFKRELSEAANNHATYEDLINRVRKLPWKGKVAHFAKGDAGWYPAHVPILLKSRV